MNWWIDPRPLCGSRFSRTWCLARPIMPGDHWMSKDGSIKWQRYSSGSHVVQYNPTIAGDYHTEIMPPDEFPGWWVLVDSLAEAERYDALNEYGIPGPDPELTLIDHLMTLIPSS